jgi:hypothetical protein
MSEEDKRIGGTIALPLAEPGAFELLHQRVQRTYGAFGERATPEATSDKARAPTSETKRTVALLLGIAVASAFLAFVSHPTYDGPRGWQSTFRLDVVFAAIWAPLLVWAFARQKLSKSLHLYVVLSLFIESFSETMFTTKGEGGYWDTFLWPASVGWYGTLKELAAIPGGSLSLFFFATVGLLYRSIREGVAPPPPRFARLSLLAFLGTVIALAALGLAQGGQVDWTFRQTIHLLQMPLVALLFLYAVRVPDDLRMLGTTYVIVAVARSLLVVFVYFAVCVRKGITDLPGKPEWCTTHSDTVLFVTALMILLAFGAQRRTVKTFGAAAIILVAIVLNNRRLAFVSLGIAPLAIYLALDPSKRKRRVTLALAVLVPLMVGYVLVGAESHSASPLLRPAKAIASVMDQKDTSAQSRDIENENLIYTLEQSPYVPSGFGHEYKFSPAHPPVDLTEVFQNYRLIAHNGVLWLWSLAGVVGFACLWFLYPLAGTLAVRGYRTALAPLERSAALAAFAAVVVAVVQIWGDQGFSSYLTMLTFGMAFAVATRLSAA